MELALLYKGSSRLTYIYCTGSTTGSYYCLGFLCLLSGFIGGGGGIFSTIYYLVEGIYGIAIDAGSGIAGIDIFGICGGIGILPIDIFLIFYGN